MIRSLIVFVSAVVLLCPLQVMSNPINMDELLNILYYSVSGNRARDYTMRLWMHEKWSTLPGWNNAVKEIGKIMEERRFDEFRIMKTPADGVTMSGAWTNPIGWDCKQATLEVIDPPNLPDEFRYLCNYVDNPTSLNVWSAPTPPEGIETELVLMESENPDELSSLNAKGKIVLTSGNTRALKRYLDKYGILGYVGDQIESINEDYINANGWMNGWSDIPGGWWMTGYDSKNNFCFSVSRKKADYLRNLLRRGRTVKVRAKIDSRYFTDDHLSYITGVINGSGNDGEEILVNGHINEWGAGDNCTGASSILEAVGTLNDLIETGKLPRPKRTIRVLLGAEMYGSIPYVVENLESLRNNTVAFLHVDSFAENYDLAVTALVIFGNPNCCPSFTDVVFPEIARSYYALFAPTRLWNIEPFRVSTDTYFCEPMIGIPTTRIKMQNGTHRHHNSMDTIDSVDPRTLRELCTLNAAFLYYMANVGYAEFPKLANLTFERGMNIIQDETKKAADNIMKAKDGEVLGNALAEGLERIKYHAGLQTEALASIDRIIAQDKKSAAHKFLKMYQKTIRESGQEMTAHIQKLADEKTKSESITINMPTKKDGPWEKEAATLIPKRFFPVTLFLAEIPSEEWVEVKSSPHWWTATNWAETSYWWCDGKRNLNQIKKLIELEAGIPVKNFDLIKYYKFLEKYNYVEFQ
ncbi:MAG: M28 family peptidase [Candidatus Latescibacteria bacterium]|nr:M28 family peptidase [Candidatus Latescibacterota bacterium]